MPPTRQRVPRVPEPRLRTLRNLTPFPHFQCDKMGPGRLLYDTVVVKATYDLVPDRLATSADATPIALADAYWSADDVTRSSVRVAGDLCVSKPSTDVLVTGSARPPTGRALDAWDVAVVVRDDRETIASAALRATGPRAFEHRLGRGWALSAPAAVDEVPIRYELAYGGAHPDPTHRPGAGEAHRWVVDRANPCGVGAWDEATLDTSKTYRGPQWENVEAPCERPGVPGMPLSGLGPVARWWSARARFAGTYDDAWKRAARSAVLAGGVADYPHDFDARFFQCAHPSLVCARPLRGDERVGLGGLIGGASQFLFQLPGHAIHAELLDAGGRWHEARLPLDTVHVDLDAARVTLSWRLAVCQLFAVTGAVLSLGTSEAS
ncbi:MAG: DUF2169 domain-containing protein [Sandaracinaceae bacterium]